MDKKLAVYLCRGCDIGGALDMDALKDVATDEYKIDRCSEHDCLCGDEGRALIAQDVSDGVNSIVVAACSQRFMQDAFAFENVLTTRVNLREQVVWSHEPNDEDTDMMAQDYLRMGIVRGQKAGLSEPLQEEVDRTVMVVGGGVTGLTAALDAAQAGNDVVLIEKEAQPGWLDGQVGQGHSPRGSLHRSATDSTSPSRSLQWKPTRGSRSTPEHPSTRSRACPGSST